MRTLISLLFVLLSVVLASACTFNTGSLTRVDGSGQVVTEARSVSGMNTVAMNGGGKLYIEQTGSESLSITTDANILPYLTTEVRGGQLILGSKPGATLGRFTDMTIRVTMKDLRALDLKGAVVADISGINTDQLQVTLNGASAVRVSGKVDRQTLTLSGTGGYNGENLESRNTQVTNNGAGAAIVRVSTELNAQINGLGYVEYIGSPAVQKSINGIGLVRQR